MCLFLSPCFSGHGTGSSGLLRQSEDSSDLQAYLAGEYELLGRVPDSRELIHGTVSIVQESCGLRLERTVNGKKVAGTARIAFSGADNVPVLRASFRLGGKEYEATFLWRSDLNNYPVLTGVVFDPTTKSPGLEAWFPMGGRPEAP